MADPISLFPLFAGNQVYPASPMEGLPVELVYEDLATEVEDASVAVELPEDMYATATYAGAVAELETGDVAVEVTGDVITVVLPEEVCACLRAGG